MPTNQKNDVQYFDKVIFSLTSSREHIRILQRVMDLRESSHNEISKSKKMFLNGKIKVLEQDLKRTGDLIKQRNLESNNV